jgi:hypothetical protein
MGDWISREDTLQHSISRQMVKPNGLIENLKSIFTHGQVNNRMIGTNGYLLPNLHTTIENIQALDFHHFSLPMDITHVSL